MSIIKKRILLVSDIHYTTELVYSELKKLYPDSNTSAAAGKTFGKTQREKGEKVELEEVLKDIEQRDYNDSHRDIAPLKQADDAVLVDTTEYDLEGSFELLLKTVDTLAEK